MSLDERWMGRAIRLAVQARAEGLRPFGCVIVLGSTPLAHTWGSETPTDPTRHSELVAIRRACRTLKGLLHGATLYSTHEPCAMCCGAICHAKISRVVFGSYREDLPSLFRQREYGVEELLVDTSVPVEVTGGVLREECAALFNGEIEERVRVCHAEA